MTATVCDPSTPHVDLPAAGRGSINVVSLAGGGDAV